MPTQASVPLHTEGRSLDSTPPRVDPVEADGYKVLNEVELNQVMVSFGDGVVHDRCRRGRPFGPRRPSVASMCRIPVPQLPSATSPPERRRNLPTAAGTRAIPAPQSLRRSPGRSDFAFPSSDASRASAAVLPPRGARPTPALKSPPSTKRPSTRCANWVQTSSLLGPKSARKRLIAGGSLRDARSSRPCAADRVR